MAHKYRDPYSNKLKSSRHNNLWNEKKKLKRMISWGADHWFPWPIVWSNYESNPYEWNNNYPAPGAYPKRQYRGKVSKKLKKQCHQRARKKEVTNYTYNKVSEYWWEIY